MSGLSRAPLRAPAPAPAVPIAAPEMLAPQQRGNAAMIEELAATTSAPVATPGLLLSGMIDASVLEPGGSITGVPLGDYAVQGPTLEDLFAASPSLRAALEAAQAADWRIVEGRPGAGTYTLRDDQEIVIDPLDMGSPEVVAATLAHELGHATSPREPGVDMEGLDRGEYVRQNAMGHLRDEARATRMELQVRDEVLQGEPEADLSITGATADEKLAAWASYQGGGLTEAQLVDEIAVLFGLGESPSTAPDETYFDYYAAPYEEAWDARRR